MEIKLVKRIRSEFPFPPFLIAEPGIYKAYSNPHGAISIKIDGEWLGVKPHEFQYVIKVKDGVWTI